MQRFISYFYLTMMNDQNDIVNVWYCKCDFICDHDEYDFWILNPKWNFHYLLVLSIVLLVVCTVVGSYSVKLLDLYIKPHYFNSRPLVISNRLFHPLRDWTTSASPPSQCPLCLLHPYHGGRLLHSFIQASPVQIYLPIPTFLSVLLCTLLLASNAHPHFKHSARYITLKLRLNLVHARYQSSATNGPMTTNNNKLTVYHPWIPSLTSTYSGPDPTRPLHRPHYVRTSSSPVTPVNGRKIQKLIEFPPHRTIFAASCKADHLVGIAFYFLFYSCLVWISEYLVATTPSRNFVSSYMGGWISFLSYSLLNAWGAHYNLRFWFLTAVHFLWIHLLSGCQ